MSELINNEKNRKQLLKHMILQLHEGQAPEQVRKQLIRLMGQVPYNEVVEVEQELIEEGLPQEEVLKLCDIHTAALEGAIDQTGAKVAPKGHPVHTFREENRALAREVDVLKKLYEQIEKLNEKKQINELFKEIQQHFNALADVEKHYSRKENLLFPFLEKHGITGPPQVMWGKHDETREFLKAAFETFAEAEKMTIDEARTVCEMVLKPASKSIEEMIGKEEEILFPMTLDTLTEDEWHQIYSQSIEIGFCLYDPTVAWKPEKITEEKNVQPGNGRIQLPSGSFTVEELTTLLNTIPFDMTFVDKDDKVRFFSQGQERIFARNRAILGRDVQKCHPPSSAHIVENILDDFKSRKQDSASFWIQMGGKFILIEYFAMRNPEGDYLGTLEVSQDLTEKRKLEGEQRLLDYSV